MGAFCGGRIPAKCKKRHVPKNFRPAAPFWDYDVGPKGPSAAKTVDIFSGPVGPGCGKAWRWRMTFVPVMWIAWSAIAVIMVALHVYRSSLEKDEEDQLFLDDSFEHERAANAAIVARASRVEPLVRVSHWLLAAASVVVIVYYVWDIMAQLGVVH